MCQISVVVEREGEEELFLDNVTRLEVGRDAILLSTFFEEPKEISGVSISRIDFLGGKVFLEQSPDTSDKKE